ncbi:pantothenate synthetase [Wolfiporia cocos MD-104 SS10]|uniref:Pantoate--beta-alanine ligase n=1 Tax=Wolfiporia cocos (strain MD-104) TaxID=742152 RepID=A0A2H3J3R9_WOLCO|nr:pantothenate synthetase [Wolfiporia cocos MD-104 SS10]
MAAVPANLASSSIPILATVQEYREWRSRLTEAKLSVGLAATMGALHEGHLSLVRRSLAENDRTVVSIFVNPTQFAPHEDLNSYPRTLARDLELLSSLRAEVGATHPNGHQERIVRTPSAVFLPSVSEMYPSGLPSSAAEQKGTFVEVQGYGDKMEGRSRPHFFRGIATVVTKLFNVIEPTRAYFGQKDIQQALLLRRMTRDLLLSHPTPENLIIVPTARDPGDSLALSSRNAYLNAGERTLAAPALYCALDAARQAWDAGKRKAECILAAYAVISDVLEELKAGGRQVQLEIDYIEMNDPDTFDELPDATTKDQWELGMADVCLNSPVIVSGAVRVGKARLIDNLILGDARKIGIHG